MLCTLVIDTGTFPYALREKERLDAMHLGDCYRELKNRRLDSLEKRWAKRAEVELQEKKE
jgi:hypothetical protein